jgi:hypothetical protein
MNQHSAVLLVLFKKKVTQITMEMHIHKQVRTHGNKELFMIIRTELNLIIAFRVFFKKQMRLLM